MDHAAIVTSFVTLFVIIDPIGLAPLFVALTQGMTSPHRRAIALRACTLAFGLLLAFGLFGDSVLGYMGISIPAFRIAGGILLFLIALDMLFERRTKRRKTQTSDGGDDPSVFPLATPLIAGPGAITTVILLAGKTGGDYTALGITALILLAVIGLVWLSFLAAGVFERALGPTGINVVSRLLGMLVAALSVQFVIDGITTLVRAAP